MRYGVPGPLPGPFPILRAHFIEAPQCPETELRADCGPHGLSTQSPAPPSPSGTPREWSPLAAPCISPITRHPQDPCLHPHSSFTSPCLVGLLGGDRPATPKCASSNLCSEGQAISDGFSIPPPSTPRPSEGDKIRSSGHTRADQKERKRARTVSLSVIQGPSIRLQPPTLRAPWNKSG